MKLTAAPEVGVEVSVMVFVSVRAVRRIASGHGIV